VTRLTPSDQADTSSAPGSAAIPPQRSAQGLRLLVLGSGSSAGTLRSRAAAAGAELAQRFSARVTHVVVDDTVAEDDARVARARDAGLPVLDLEQGAQLLGVSEGPALASVPALDPALAQASVDALVAESVDAVGGVDEVAQEGAFEVAVEVAGAEIDGGAESAQRGGGEDRAQVVAEDEVVAADVVAGAEVAEEKAEETEEAIELVRPRSEYTAEPLKDDDGPSNVFAGSALEAVLLFPPLPAEESVMTCGCGEGCGGQDLDLDLVDVVDVVGVLDAVDEVGGGGGAVDEYAIDGDELGGDSGGGDVAESEVAVSAVRSLRGASKEVPAAEHLGQSAGVAAASASVAWALVPLASLGLLTPVAMGYAAYRLRSRPLAAATGWYTLAVVAAFTVSAAVPHGGAQSPAGDLLAACLATSWVGGTIHSLLIRKRVFG
jgi:hypothetical protein